MKTIFKSFLLALAVVVSGFGQDITIKSLGARGGTNDDTVFIQRGLTNSSANGVALDLQGGTYLSSQVVIDRQVTVRNGTIKAFNTHTNSYGWISVTNGATKVVFERVKFDGNSTVMIGMRVYPGVRGTRFKECEIVNTLQPAAINFSTAGLYINGETEGRTDGLTISNVIGVANGVIGSDSYGVARGIMMVTSASEAFPEWTFDHTKIYKVSSTADAADANANEDSDAIAVHRFGEGLAPIVFLDTRIDGARKRGFKIMQDGITIDGFEVIPHANTNSPMYSPVSGYAGVITVKGGKIHAGPWLMGIDILNNQSAMSGVIVDGNQIGMGTNTVVGWSLGTLTQEGIRLGGSYGTTNLVVVNNIIGSAWAKPLIAIHLMGGITNGTVSHNLGWSTEHGILDGYRYSGESGWGTNRNIRYDGNMMLGAPSFAGFRLRKSASISLGANFSDSSTPIYFDNGYAATVSASALYQINLLGGTVKDLTAPLIGGSATATTFTGPFTPQLQWVDVSVLGKAAASLEARGTNNPRAMFYVDDTTSTWGLDSTYSAGGVKTFKISQAGTDWWKINGTTIEPGLSIVPNAGNTIDVGATGTYMRSGYFQTGMSIGKASFTTGDLIFGNASTANTTTIRPGAPGSSIVLTLPTAAGTLLTSGDSAPYFTQTADVTVNNSAAETTILGTVTGSKTLAVNVLTQGKLLHGIVRGRYGSDTVTPGTMRIKVKLGSVTILDSGAQTLPNSATTKLFDIDYDLICRTTGGTGTVWAQGKVLIGDTSGLIPQVFPMVNTSTSTIDTTATQAVDITVTFSVADADNTVTASIASLQ